jgi:hypothetical protein
MKIVKRIPWVAIRSRYGWPELWGLIGAVIGFLAGFIPTRELIGAVFLSSTLETVFYMGTVAYRAVHAEFRTDKTPPGSAKWLSLRSYGRAAWKSMDFIIANVIDWLSSRPLLMGVVSAYFARKHFWGSYMTGFLCGKVLADLFYFAMIGVTLIGLALPKWLGRLWLCIRLGRGYLTVLEHRWPEPGVLELENEAW